VHFIAVNVGSGAFFPGKANLGSTSQGRGKDEDKRKKIKQKSDIKTRTKEIFKNKI
jgi:hypothetical protein